MTAKHAKNDLAGGENQCGKQGYCAVSHAIPRYPFRNVGRQRQNGLGTVRRLNLALVVGTQDQHFDRRVQVQTHDIEECDYLIARGCQRWGEPQN